MFREEPDVQVVPGRPLRCNVGQKALQRLLLFLAANLENGRVLNARWNGDKMQSNAVIDGRVKVKGRQQSIERAVHPLMHPVGVIIARCSCGLRSLFPRINIWQCEDRRENRLCPWHVPVVRDNVQVTIAARVNVDRSQPIRLQQQ